MVLAVPIWLSSGSRQLLGGRHPEHAQRYMRGFLPARFVPRWRQAMSTLVSSFTAGDANPSACSKRISPMTNWHRGWLALGTEVLLASGPAGTFRGLWMVGHWLLFN